MIVPFAIGYGDETLDGNCCFRRHLAVSKFDTSGSKTMVTEFLAFRVGVSLFKEVFRVFKVALDALEDISGPLTLYLVVLLRQLSLSGPMQLRSWQRTVLQQDVILPVPQFRLVLAQW